MRDIATATLTGNLTQDVEVRPLPSGSEVARLRVATSTRRRRGETWVDKTGYYTVEVYGPLAGSCAKYLCKGSRVVVEAELDWREWTDEHERRREAVTLRAKQVLFEGSRPASAEADQAAAANGSGGGERSESEAVAAAAGDGSASETDLPF